MKKWDVLARYLRMYQILEYFGFRRILADMTKGNIRENGFVRNVINKASGRSTNELEEIKKGLSGVLPDLSTVIAPGDISAPQNAFIPNKLLISSTTHDNARMWSIVYKLRNCIVHNKESDLHFTYSNIEVYQDGISLMKMLIEKLEPEIVKVINDPAITGLEFSEQKVQVY